MAWSLSQIVAVGLPGSGMVFEEQTEHYIAFFDIFVNYAFSNYRSLMEAFSFNVIMGGWLSFIGNKSLQANIDEEVRTSHYLVLLSFGVRRMQSYQSFYRNRGRKVSLTRILQEKCKFAQRGI